MATYMESDNRSDEDFEVGSEDFDTSDSYVDLSLSDDDEEGVEPRTAEDWVFITDPYHDASPPSFDFAPVYTDVHPAVELESLRSPLECFLAFVPEKLITYLCDCTNKRACSYFTDSPCSHFTATASEDNAALGSLQASLQAPGQTTGVAGVR
ncbi:UNVERIFIED_CONTAM: hypothetical protein FKN15_008968 [Acipenser sinensis]